MNRSTALSAFAPFLGVLLALSALPASASPSSVVADDYPRSLDTEGPVAVSWTDPAQFTEIRFSRNRFEAVRGDWVRELARHVAKRAGKALAPGERLEVRITDIKLAGEFEPAAGRTDHVRVIRDIYPPRIALEYTRYDPRGGVVDSGKRELSDMGFLMHSGRSLLYNEPLRHEKRLLDDWISRDVRRDASLAASGN